MACLLTTYVRVGSPATITTKRIGGDIKATFALVCNNSVGEILLCDADGKYLLTSDGEYLTVKK